VLSPKFLFKKKLYNEKCVEMNEHENQDPLFHYPIDSHRLIHLFSLERNQKQKLKEENEGQVSLVSF